MNLKNSKNQLRGARNRAAGAIFENYIDASCDYYSRTGEAVIEKTPEPMKVIKNLGGGKFMAVFEKKAQPDYKGTLKTGRTIIFEAKHTESDRIEQSRLTDKQIEFLSKYHNMGAQCYVLVTVQMRTFYFVPWQVWRDMKEIYGRKYMTVNELKLYQVPFVNGTIRFLERWIYGNLC